MSLPYSARYPVIQTQTWTKLGEKDYIRKYYARLISALLTLYQAHLQGRALNSPHTTTTPLKVLTMQKEAAVVKPIRSLEDALNRCQALGMRLSRQRRLILELLWQDREHLSARDIYDRLNQQGKEIGHTSVYQNLEALSSQGIIECIERSDGRLYGNISDAHSHVNCVDTDQIMDVYVELPDELIQHIEQQTGVKITEYRIDFYGYRNGKQDDKS